MTEKELKIADYIISHHIDLLRLESGVQAEVLRILDELGRELEKTLLMSEVQAGKPKRDVEALLKKVTEVIDEYYSALQDPIRAAMSGVADVQAHVVRNALTSSFVINIEAGLPATAFMTKVLNNMVIQGATLGEWFKRQKADVAFRFGTIVRQGMVNGETNAQILRKVMGTPGTADGAGIIGVSKHNIRTLIHTTIQTTANTTRLESIRANADVNKGVKQMSTLDNRTSITCIAYSGAAWDLEGKPIAPNTLPFNGGPPRHFNCRSILVPIPKTYKELGLNIPEPPVGERASMFGPVREDITMEQFLKRAGKDFTDDLLGTDRAEMWRSGKITLQQLLDQRGRPLSVAQLKRKYAS